MKRRDFLRATAGVAAGLAAANTLADDPTTDTVPVRKAARVSRLERPVAIAMWDFSWLLRHHPAGEFENWDEVLDQLVERGYNAIRLDCFPHLVAATPDGVVGDSFAFPKGDWRPAMWGNSYSTTVNPRGALLEFLPKCRERGVHVGLSAWFFGPGVE